MRKAGAKVKRRVWGPLLVAGLLALAVVQTVRLGWCATQLEKTKWMLSSRGYEACIRGEHAWHMELGDTVIHKVTGDYIAGSTKLFYRCEWCGKIKPEDTGVTKAATLNYPSGYAVDAFDLKMLAMELRRARGHRLVVEVYWLNEPARRTKPKGVRS